MTHPSQNTLTHILRFVGRAVFGARCTTRRWLCAGVLVLAFVHLACQPPEKPQREIFEEAEAAYRSGDYDKALKDYEAFLKAAPEHQLAPLAQQRVLSIERELEVVMGRQNGPRPIYLRPVNP